MRALAVLCVKNEGAFLLEWIAHHRAVGFTDFLVFSNDCDDGTDAILDRLDAMGQITHVRNDGPYDKGGIQWTAYKMADKHPLVKAADWVMTLDVDEFVNIHVGDRTLTALFDALPDATAFTMTWRLFGSSDLRRFSDHPVTKTFTRAAPAKMAWPWRASMFKTLYKNTGVYGKLGVHRPRNPDKSRLDEARWFDGRGMELPEMFKTRRLFSNYGRDNYPMFQLNHYALGAMETYILKAARGRAVHGADQLGVDYWVERNYNQDEDTTIHALASSVNPLIQTLRDDATLLALHNDAVEWRKTRFTELMMEEPFRALFGRLLQTPPSRLVDPDEARALYKFAQLGKRAEQG